MPPTARFEPAGIQGPPDHTVVFLLDAATELERRLLDRWVRSHAGASAETLRILGSRGRRSGDNQALAARLAVGDDPFFIPVRVVWMAPERQGRRSVGWSDILKPGDPRDPRGLRAHWILLAHPERVEKVAGVGAAASDLAEAYRESDEVDGLVPFVTRRAWRALDLPERALRGNRHKVPRFVAEAILSRRSFVEAVERHAVQVGSDPGSALAKARRYLKEIAATHSPYVIDLVANAIHALYSQGYGQISYLPEQVRKVAALGNAHPVVFLPSHRSNLDRLSLQFLLWENDLPPNHTAGGVNLNFFPLGPLMRRTGVFFIRRTFKSNDLYKLVLRSYIDFLIEKRFSLEWYMEGGRSRSGKLQPPRFGLLHYVVDSLHRGKADDVMLVPVSITYDQIQDVPDYTREALGRAKERESVRWLLKAVRSLRRRYGDIHIRFGEAVSVAGLATGIEGDGESIELRKVAFEVMNRIAMVTPITPITVVGIALLAARGKAQTATGLARVCADLVDFIGARGLEMTEEPDLTDPAKVTVVLDLLAEHGAVSSHEALGRTVYWLDDPQMIQVSYYRNVVVHYFVPRAIAEVVLASGAGDSDQVETTMLALRDLLKFEFFFAERARFIGELGADLRVDVPDWERILGDEGPAAVLAKLGTPIAHWALLPILDSYQVVGDELEALSGAYEEKRFLRACLARARMYRIEERLISGESASQVLFKSALALAANRGLLDHGATDARADFAAEVREARRLAAMGL